MIKKILIVLAAITIIPGITGGIVRKRSNNSVNTDFKGELWCLNSYRSLPGSNQFYNVNFISNSVNFNMLQCLTNGWILYRKSSDGNWITIFNGGSLVNPDYALIYFVSGDTTNSDMINLFNSNFTKLGVNV